MQRLNLEAEVFKFVFVILILCNKFGDNCIQNFIWGGISSDIRSKI